MSQTLTLTVAAANLLTANQRLHWAARSRITKTLRDTAGLSARAQRLTPMDRAHLTVHISWPDRRRRDAHNILPTLKACIDGLVDAGVLVDDDDTHLTGPDIRVTEELSGIPRVTRLRFELEEVTP